MKSKLQFLALALACSTAAARADTEAILSYNSSLLGIFHGTAGWTFQPQASFTVTELGCFDYLLNSQTNITVGLWDSGGGLLASVVVTTNDVLFNASRYVPITSVGLSAGQTYYVGAFAPSGTISGDVVSPQDGGSAATSLQVLLGLTAYSTNSAFEFPGLTQGTTGSGFMGPNFEYNQAVPEPASVALFGAGGAILAGWSWRRKRTC